MAESYITNARYTYIHHGDRGPVDVHHIVAERSVMKGFMVYLFALFLTANGLFLFVVKDRSVTVLIWSLILSAVLVKVFLRNPIHKESVIIFPAFGVQLETQYGSGKTIRRFVPLGKVLKPVLNECVTPVTCYWSLSLIVRGEDALMLVFKELHPPVKMLIPIWKALCSAADHSIEGVDSAT